MINKERLSSIRSELERQLFGEAYLIEDWDIEDIAEYTGIPLDGIEDDEQEEQA